MRLLFFVNGFPSERRPNNGIFNQRAAVDLSGLLDLTVIVPTAWIPGRRFISATDTRGIQTVVVAAPQIPRMETLNIRLFDIFLRRFLRPYVRRADLVHSVGADFAGLICGVLARQEGKPHLTQLIADLGCLNREFRTFPFFADLRGSLKGIICNSGALEQTARVLFPEVPLVETVYRGVDLERFSRDGPVSGPLAGAEPIRFLYLGGLPAYPERRHRENTKGGITLMEAWREAEASPSFAQARLLFAGPNALCSLTSRWRESLRHPENVRLQGLIPPPEVAAYIRSADAVLIPSLEEGCPNLAFEAMACGRPVFGSAIGPLTELISDGETGRLVPAGDRDAWCHLLSEYIHRIGWNELRSMGKEARKRAELLFDHRDYVRHLTRIYRKVLNLPAPTRSASAEHRPCARSADGHDNHAMPSARGQDSA